MTLLLVVCCFALSGFAALLYQTVWTRQFSLLFGTSDLAVALVLAAYMAGLALGARWVERFVGTVRRPVLVYGLLELGVGLSALAVPFALLASESLMLIILGGQSEPPSSDGWLQTSFQVVTAFVVLVIPTALMGATLPLLTRYAVHTSAQIAGRTGLLYAVNALAAAAGALIGANVLLPWLGLTRTVAVGAAVNIMVFFLAALASRRHRARLNSAHDVIAGQAPSGVRPLVVWDSGAYWILPAMLVSGAVSFAYEVLWTRMLSFVLGGSLSAFATMVASVLLGIAFGSLLASQIIRTRSQAIQGFVICQFGIAFCSAAIYLLLPALLPQQAGLAGNASMALLVLLPATLFIGATFPLAVRILTSQPQLAGAATARVYAWNTVGAIIGALGAGFYLIPALRFEGSIHLAVSVNLALGLLSCAFLLNRRLVFSSFALIASITMLILFQPLLPERLLRMSPLNGAEQGNMVFYDVGRSATVVMLEQDGSLSLRTNGLPESSITTPGVAPTLVAEKWLSALAVLARPKAESALVVGYGGGIALIALAPSVQAIDVIELEPAVIAANRSIADVRALDPLQDSRITIIQNDARAALALTTKQYELIISQPSHPWTAGASHLYTLEFMQQARRHLTDDGVFVQWMGADFLDEALLRSLASTLLAAFEHVRLYRPSPQTLVFLASRQPLEVEDISRSQGSALKHDPGHFARLGIRTPEDILAALAADQRGIEWLAKDAMPITDDMNLMATSQITESNKRLDVVKLSELLSVHDPLTHEPVKQDTAYDYLARRMALFSDKDPSIPKRIERMAALVKNLSTSQYVSSVSAAATGDVAAAQQHLRDALKLNPDNDAARYDFVRSFLGALVRNGADSNIIDVAAKLPNVPSALIEAGRLSLKGDWIAIAALDEVLASAKATEAWYTDCVQMRIVWRISDTRSAHAQQRGQEALALVDELIVSQSGLPMYMLRVQSALAAGRQDAMLESISSYVDEANALNNRLNDSEVAAISSTLDNWLSMLHRITLFSYGQQQRMQAVRTKLMLVREQLRQHNVLR
jgi:spermidine synthase